ncbi:CaiB/BaiF CoA transferase family protein [Cupriavidus neocaledonicus]|uniref:Crotonobetainyl-CoA:carnitine CoA-transferase CaiB n=1 Tax=Cupriavidus neocaledonicus TaxID=1040979 RepID=A0A375HRI4_9BURK|nr:CaiB/BaiF CoA-transferase family protein [Cupriavidus neocaledonicus]SOZ39868.1 Putative formyl-coenzyme A transferase [Cupriavidus neocaledonicus]SPD60798.1 Crotonobetainyl-CoA:carnitine CoA-transferase CaiB [Cupriavidus neocaledonicus]
MPDPHAHAVSPESPGAGPLAGLRILDMATVVAAPFSATLCADMGAAVVKLELPDGSDPLRGLEPVTDDHALYWKVTNRGKRGISLDVRTPRGREIFLRLLPRFDVLVENFRTGTLARWGLDLETLHAANPGLIVLRLTGFGQTGPDATRPGFARIFEARSGFTNLAGTAQSGPMHMNYPVGDMIAGLFGAFAIATAVAEQRARPGQPGREIDLAATEALFRLLDPLAIEYEQLGHVRQRAGNRTTYAAPSNMYRTADDTWVTVVASSDATFRRLAEAMDAPQLAQSAEYATNAGRVRHIEALDGCIAGWFAAQPYAAAAARLEYCQVPFSKVFSIADIVVDPQMVARQAIVRLPDADLGTVPAPCVVPRFSGYVPPLPRTGPDVGEHNAEVYGELGIGEEELARLRGEGVV